MIKIDDLDYNLILKSVGYPIIKEDELEYSKEEILSFFVQPSMKDYFIWFPLVERQIVNVNNQTFEIPFPKKKIKKSKKNEEGEDIEEEIETDNPFLYGVASIRFSPSSYGLTRSGNVFVDTIHYSANKHHPWGSPYTYGLEESYYLKRNLDVTKMDQLRAVDYKVDEQNRVVKGFSNDVGELVIDWAKWSDNFNDIPFKSKNEVIDLISGRLMVDIARIESRINTGTGVEINTNDLKEDGQKKIDDVLSKWKNISKIAIQR